MQVYTKQAFHHDICPTILEPNTARATLPSPTSLLSWNGLHLNQSPTLDEEHVDVVSLSREQEECFLNLFWQSYHTIVPILKEAEFRAYYDSLWTSSSSGACRAASALVDIILALCMQYGSPLTTPGAAGVVVDDKDSSIAGRWLYRRSEPFLSYERENPRLATIQCQIYSSIYLMNASFINMAHSTIATATRAAYLLGFDRLSTDNVSKADQDLRQRAWWTLFLLDSQISMELGRPFLFDALGATFAPPTEDLLGATMRDTEVPWFEDVNLLSYHTQSVKLAFATRSASEAFQLKCSEILTLSGKRDVHDDPKLLEECARFLPQCMKPLRDWVDEVPKALRIARNGVGEPFSTARTTLDLDFNISLWLQRQRPLLELLYHNFSMPFYRTFIGFQTRHIVLDTTFCGTCRLMHQSCLDNHEHSSSTPR